MKGKIAFEEHVAIPETLEQTRAFAGESGRWDDFTQRLLDVDNQRLEDMEATGIDFAILSINAPGVQAVLDTKQAIEVARKGNERLAEAVTRHPRRYAALAALPMQDADAAAAELTRCVRELGFKGAMVNGFTQKDVPDSAVYYDLPEYRSFWATVAELERRGTPIGDADTRVASIALSRGLTVVTGNERHFRQVPGLEIENWLQG
jgi:gamma-resorcylate decarboxylase